MVWCRRIGLLCVGIICSCGFGSILILRCLGATEAPAVVQASMRFPYTLTDQPLILHGVFGYEGPYVEDGTDREVCDVAALLVENTGDAMLVDTSIAVYYPNGCYLFYAQCLPAGEMTVVLEKEAKLFQGEKLLSCWAYSEANVQPLAKNIQIRQLGMDVLEITNEESFCLGEIVILHKNWSKEAEAYLGGVVYKTYIRSVRPGQLVLVKPGHYAKTVSKVLAAVSQ